MNEFTDLRASVERLIAQDVTVSDRLRTLTAGQGNDLAGLLWREITETQLPRRLKLRRDDGVAVAICVQSGRVEAMTSNAPDIATALRDFAHGATGVTIESTVIDRMATTTGLSPQAGSKNLQTLFSALTPSMIDGVILDKGTVVQSSNDPAAIKDLVALGQAMANADFPGDEPDHRPSYVICGGARMLLTMIDGDQSLFASVRDKELCEVHDICRNWLNSPKT